MSSALRRVLDVANMAGLWRLNNHTLNVARPGVNNGTATAVTYEDGPHGRSVAVLNGTTSKVDCGDVGSIRTISLWVKPTTTTEELILLDTGSDIMINAGTVTYATVTADATYVDGELGTTMVAGVWQHLVCVLSAAIDANNFEIGTDGTNFGAGSFANVRAYVPALTGDEAKALFLAEHGGVV